MNLGGNTKLSAIVLKVNLRRVAFLIHKIIESEELVMNYVVDSYENYKEENRLTTNNARRIEFVTTTRVLDEIIGTKS